MTKVTLSFCIRNLEIDNMLSTLKAKKRKLEADSKQVELEVLLYFLKNTRAEKQEVGSSSGTDRFAIVGYYGTHLQHVLIFYPFFSHTG